MKPRLYPSESERVQEIACEYQDKGYLVVVEPHGAHLPEALAGFQPDLLASSAEETVVVEVKYGNLLSEQTDMPALADAVATLPGWRFELVVIGQKKTASVVPAAQDLNETEIRRWADAAQQLLNGGYPETALLAAWSVAETALRAAARAQDIPLEGSSALQLVKDLYSLGLLSPDEYGFLQKIMKGRNRLAHGYSWSEISDQQVTELLGLATRLSAANVAPA